MVEREAEYVHVRERVLEIQQYFTMYSALEMETKAKAIRMCKRPQTHNKHPTRTVPRVERVPCRHAPPEALKQLGGVRRQG